MIPEEADSVIQAHRGIEVSMQENVPVSCKDVTPALTQAVWGVPGCRVGADGDTIKVMWSYWTVRSALPLIFGGVFFAVAIVVVIALLINVIAALASASLGTLGVFIGVFIRKVIDLRKQDLKPVMPQERWFRANALLTIKMSPSGQGATTVCMGGVTHPAVWGRIQYTMKNLRAATPVTAQPSLQKKPVVAEGFSSGAQDLGNLPKTSNALGVAGIIIGAVVLLVAPMVAIALSSLGEMGVTLALLLSCLLVMAGVTTSILSLQKAKQASSSRTVGRWGLILNGVALLPGIFFGVAAITAGSWVQRVAVIVSLITMLMLIVSLLYNLRRASRVCTDCGALLTPEESFCDVCGAFEPPYHY